MRDGVRTGARAVAASMAQHVAARSSARHAMDGHEARDDTRDESRLAADPRVWTARHWAELMRGSAARQERERAAGASGAASRGPGRTAGPQASGAGGATQAPPPPWEQQGRPPPAQHPPAASSTTPSPPHRLTRELSIASRQTHDTLELIELEVVDMQRICEAAENTLQHTAGSVS